MKSILNLVTGMMMVGGTCVEAQTAILDIPKNDGDQPKAEIAVDEQLPVIGVRYYYYPNLDSYFDTETNLYVFEEDGQWVTAPEMSRGYRGYSLLNNVRVEITDYNGDKPFEMLEEHRKQFPKKYSSKRIPPKDAHEATKVAYN